MFKRLVVPVAYYLAFYIIVGVITFTIISFIGSALIINGNESELGRMGQGVFGVVIGLILSFGVIAPTALLSLYFYRNFYRQKEKKKRKRKSDAGKTKPNTAETEGEWVARSLNEELGDALRPDGSIDFENLETVHIPFDELEAGLDDE